MNKAEWLKKLQMELYRLPRAEIDDAIAYYGEYFEEAGPEREEDIIKELGTPSKIAAQIKADYAVKQLDVQSKEIKNGEKKTVKSAWLIVLAVIGGIFAAPIALPIAAALGAIAIAISAVIGSVFLALFATVLGIFVGSVVLIVCSFMLIPLDVFAWLLYFGLGLVGASIGALLMVAIVALGRKIVRSIATLLSEKRKKKMKEKGVEDCE